MVVPGKSCGFICFTDSLLLLPPVKKSGRRRFATTLAKRKEPQEKNSKSGDGQTFFPLRLSKPVIARTAIGVFGLGFVDAGYSGDWSRIGAITPQSEELLKIAAFLVVPLCIFLIFSLPNESDS